MKQEANEEHTALWSGGAETATTELLWEGIQLRVLRDYHINERAGKNVMLCTPSAYPQWQEQHPQAAHILSFTDNQLPHSASIEERSTLGQRALQQHEDYLLRQELEEELAKQPPPPPRPPTPLESLQGYIINRRRLEGRQKKGDGRDTTAEAEWVTWSTNFPAYVGSIVRASTLDNETWADHYQKSLKLLTDLPGPRDAGFLLRAQRDHGVDEGDGAGWEAFQQWIATFPRGAAIIFHTDNLNNDKLATAKDRKAAMISALLAHYNIGVANTSTGDPPSNLTCPIGL